MEKISLAPAGIELNWGLSPPSCTNRDGRQTNSRILLQSDARFVCVEKSSVIDLDTFFSPVDSFVSWPKAQHFVPTWIRVSTRSTSLRVFLKNWTIYDFFQLLGCDWRCNVILERRLKITLPYLENVSIIWQIMYALSIFLIWKTQTHFTKENPGHSHKFSKNSAQKKVICIFDHHFNSVEKRPTSSRCQDFSTLNQVWVEWCEWAPASNI